MLIDCEVCPVRQIACDDCVVTVLLGLPQPRTLELDDSEQDALSNLATVGLIPPLQGGVRQISDKLERTSA